MPKLSLNASKNTKHTPAGEIPVDWGCVKFGEAISSTQLGGNYAGELADSGTPLMKMGNMLRGKFDVTRFERIPDSQVNECDILHKEDLLLNTRNSLDLVGKVSMWRNELERAVFNSNMMRLSPNQKFIQSNAFLNYVLNSEYCLKEIAQRATGTTSVAAIYWRDLATMRLPLPPCHEQCKIADILSTWDETLETLDALIAAKDHQKQALMQQLLTGKTRVKGAKGKWISAKLGDLFDERVERDRIDLPLLSITADRGVVPRDELAKRDTSSEDKSKYLRIAPGDIGYNTMRMWQGVSALSTLEGIVSPAYTICRPTTRIDGMFAAHFFKFPHTIHLFHRWSQGLVDDTLNLKFPSFSVIEVFIPESITEQQQIAAILETADQELTLLRTQRQTLDQQKRGLMQRLLTGKIRVNAPT